MEFISLKLYVQARLQKNKAVVGDVKEDRRRGLRRVLMCLPHVHLSFCVPDHVFGLKCSASLNHRRVGRSFLTTRLRLVVQHQQLQSRIQ